MIVLVVASSFLKCLEPKYRLVGPNGLFGHAINASCARETYHQLPWLYTRPDIETVHWINQSLSTLWPSLQTLTNKFLVDSYKPKHHRKWTMQESKQLVGKCAKLSLILSSKRKLSILRKRVSASFSCTHETCCISSLIRALVDAIKIFVIYLKQFIIDFIVVRFLSLQLKRRDRFPKISDQKEKVSSEQRAKPKSWAGFKSCVVNRKKLMSRSAPVELNSSTGKKVVFKALKSVEKLRRKRLALAETLENLAFRTKQSKTVRVERIKLGKSCPVISGFKLVDDQTRSTNTANYPNELATSKSEQSLRFSGEITFSSGSGFGVLISRLPLLNTVELQSLRLKVRFIIILNHSIENNDELEILSNDIGSKLPKINSVQIAPEASPELDWFLRIPSNQGHSTRFPLARLITSQNLIWILNHPYFKYFSHNVLYILLKWFSSFDIEVGSKVYFRSLL